MPPLKVAVVFYSGFKGNIESLAIRIGKGAAKIEGSQVKLVSVDQVDQHWNFLHDCNAIIFGSPTYVGSLAANFKLFVEMLAGEVWLERLWLNKCAGGFTCSAGRSGDKLNCLTDMSIFAAQMGMLWVPMPMVGGNYSTAGSEEDLNRMAGYLGVMAQANIDESSDQAPPESDLMTAELYGQHIASVAAAFVRGNLEKITGSTASSNDEEPGRRPISIKDFF